MKNFQSLILMLVFSFLCSMSYAQVPDPSGDDEWDYCECVDGVQSLNDICPCEQVFPPNTGGSGTGNTGQGGDPDPGGNDGDGPNTLFLCDWLPWLC